MGVYYWYENTDRQEVISLSSVVNIKYGAFDHPHLQARILNIFLGFDPYRKGLDLGAWVGRWENQRIRLANDSKDDDHDEEWKDAGMEFLHFLRSKDLVGRFAHDAEDEERINRGIDEDERWKAEDEKRKSGDD